MTAQEYIDKWNSHEGNFSDLRLSDLLILFAQEHVEEALKQAEKVASKIAISKIDSSDYWTNADSNFILKAYPIKNIK